MRMDPMTRIVHESRQNHTPLLILRKRPLIRRKRRRLPRVPLLLQNSHLLMAEKASTTTVLKTVVRGAGENVVDAAELLDVFEALHHGVVDPGPVVEGE